MLILHVGLLMNFGSLQHTVKFTEEMFSEKSKEDRYKRNHKHLTNDFLICTSVWRSCSTPCYVI